MRILLVADHYSDHSAELMATLGKHGVRTYQMMRDDLSWPAVHDADVIILGPTLSCDDNIAICREIRFISDAPIIVISDQAGVTDQVKGLRAGADHYITRPYHFDELVAKIMAATRPRGRAGDRISSRPKITQVGDIEINAELMKVTVAGLDIALTKKEFQLLMAITREDGATCPREKLAAEVWGRPEAEVYDSIQVLMSRLRAKLGHGRIQTVRHVGYRIAATTAPAPRHAPSTQARRIPSSLRTPVEGAHKPAGKQ